MTDDSSGNRLRPQIFEAGHIIIVDGQYAQDIAQALRALRTARAIHIEQVMARLPEKVVEDGTYDLAILGYHEKVEWPTGDEAEQFRQFMFKAIQILGDMSMVIVTDNWANPELKPMFGMIPNIKAGCTLQALTDLPMVLASSIVPRRRSSSQIAAVGEPVKRPTGVFPIPGKK